MEIRVGARVSGGYQGLRISKHICRSEKILRIFRENGTKPEFEAYDVEHFHNAHHFFLEAAIQSHVLVQFVMGILGGITATIPHLLHLNKTAGELFRDDLIFSTIASGRTGSNRQGVRFGAGAGPNEARAILGLKGKDLLNI